MVTVHYLKQYCMIHDLHCPMANSPTLKNIVIPTLSFEVVKNKFYRRNEVFELPVIKFFGDLFKGFSSCLRNSEKYKDHRHRTHNTEHDEGQGHPDVFCWREKTRP